MADATKKKAKRKDNSSVIAISIIVIILAVGIIFTFFAVKNSSKTGIVEKPEVSISIGAESSENAQQFTAKMSFEGNVEAIEKINDAEYRKIVAEALNAVGYEKLTSDESVLYVKEAMKEKLSEKLKEDGATDFEIKDVYIEKLIGNKYPTNSPQKPNKNPNNPNSLSVTDMFKNKK